MAFRLVRNNLFYPNSSKFYKELHLESFRYDIVVKANLISAITAAVYSRPGQTRHESPPALFLIAPNRQKQESQHFSGRTYTDKQSLRSLNPPRLDKIQSIIEEGAPIQTNLLSNRVKDRYSGGHPPPLQGNEGEGEGFGGKGIKNK